MLNISTQHSVSWPTPVGQGVAPVGAVTAVQPVQASGRNGQSGLGAGPDAQTPGTRQRDKTGTSRTPPEALPRGTLPDEAATRASAATQRDTAAVQEAEKQATAREAAEEAADEARRQQLTEVLSNVWKASAAVVDRVLGRESESHMVQAGRPLALQAAEMPGAGTTPSVQANSPGLPWPVMPEGHGVAADADALPGQEVVAYDEHGNSSLAPLEAGSLISRRV